MNEILNREISNYIYIFLFHHNSAVGICICDCYSRMIDDFYEKFSNQCDFRRHYFTLQVFLYIANISLYCRYRCIVGFSLHFRYFFISYFYSYFPNFLTDVTENLLEVLL